MCFVFVSYLKDSVIVGANREENAMRPMDKPTIFRSAFNVLVFGQDRGRNGDSNLVGTWGGINEFGLLALVTNRDDCKEYPKNNGKRITSRGLLCAKTLSNTLSARDAVSFVTNQIILDNYKSFNMIVLDQNEAFAIHGKMPNIEIIRLFEGFHVLTNLDVNDQKDIRINFAQTYIKDIDLLYHPNVIVNDDDWGTVCSSFLSLNRKSPAIFYHSKYKPINKDSYSDYSHLMQYCSFWRKQK